MILAAISMMRDEADVALWVASHMAEECDIVLVADHRSTDGTCEILEAIPGVEVRDTHTDRYDQAGVMMRLVNEATERGADWIIPFDADEWWYARGPGMTLRDALETIEDVQTRAVTRELVPQPNDPKNGNPFFRPQYFRPWRSTMPENRKIAFRPGEDRLLMQGNHGLLNYPVPPEGPLRIRHLPYRSFDHAVRKLRRGKEVLEASDLPTAWGWHWRKWGGLTDEGLKEWWKAWTDPKGLVGA